MKLRNKKTGEVLEMERSSSVIKDKFRIYDVYKNKFYTYSSLAELNAEWEDYEEPKEYWYIGDGGEVYGFSDYYLDTEIEETHRKIGNLFETKEKAEKAVEKLKAWKRLKDKGFRFIDHIDRDSGQGMTRYEWDGYVNGEDLDLLFGGE